MPILRMHLVKGENAFLKNFRGLFIQIRLYFITTFTALACSFFRPYYHGAKWFILLGSRQYIWKNAHSLTMYRRLWLRLSLIVFRGVHMLAGVWATRTGTSRTRPTGTRTQCGHFFHFTEHHSCHRTQHQCVSEHKTLQVGTAKAHNKL